MQGQRIGQESNVLRMQDGQSLPLHTDLSSPSSAEGAVNTGGKGQLADLLTVPPTQVSCLCLPKQAARPYHSRSRARGQTELTSNKAT